MGLCGSTLSKKKPAKGYEKPLNREPAVRPTFHLVLDIDECTGNRSLIISSPDSFAWFRKRNLIFPVLLTDGVIERNMEFLIFPGAVEWVTHLLQIPNLRLSFFSAGDECMNVSFIEELLLRALGEYKYKEMQDCISIFSGHHTIGDYVKNISVVQNEPLNNVLLVDNSAHHLTGNDNPKNVWVVDSIFRGIFEHTKPEHFFLVNQIFYLAGVLDDSFQNGKDNFLEYHHKLLSSMTDDMKASYLLRGFDILKKINPKLELYGGDAALAYFTKFNHQKMDNEEKLLQQPIIPLSSVPSTLFNSSNNLKLPPESKDQKSHCHLNNIHIPRGLNL